MNLQKLYELIMNDNKAEALELVKKEIAVSCEKTTSTKQRLTKCYNYAKKIASGVKPILGSVIYKDGYQFFSDGYMFAALVEEDYTTIDECKTPDNYPNININNFTNINNAMPVKLNVNELKTACKTTKLKNTIAIYSKSLNASFGLDTKEFDYFLTFMNVKTDEIELYYKQFNTPLVLIKDNGSKGCICPCRLPDGAAADIIVE